MRLRRAAALVALIAMAYVGLNNATSWPGAANDGQHVAVVVSVLSGILSLVTAIALWRGWSSLRPLLFVWAASVAASAGLATWAWANAPARVWLISTCVGLAIGAAISAVAWSARTRELQP